MGVQDGKRGSAGGSLTRADLLTASVSKPFAVSQQSFGVPGSVSLSSKEFAENGTTAKK